jgi:hypothetical protein
MALPVVTVASGGLPVVDVTAAAPLRGMPITEVVGGRGMAVTKVSGTLGLPVTYVTADGQVVPPLIPAAFNPATVSNTSLSNGNLTATHSNTSAGGARVAATLTAGKYYFEMTLNVGSGGQDAFGLMLSSDNYLNFLTNGVAVQRATGNIYSNGITGKTLGAFANGNILGAAIDLTGRLAWFRKGAAGIWNNDGTANPATGIGGVTVVPTVAFGPGVCFSGAGTAANDAYTANFGASAFSGAVPSGYAAGWPA